MYREMAGNKASMSQRMEMFSFSDLLLAYPKKILEVALEGCSLLIKVSLASLLLQEVHDFNINFRLLKVSFSFSFFEIRVLKQDLECFLMDIGSM